MEVPLNAMWLTRWINTETLWNKKEVSRASPEIAARRLLISTKNDKPREQMGPRVSIATGTEMYELLIDANFKDLRSAVALAAPPTLVIIIITIITIIIIIVIIIIIISLLFTHVVHNISTNKQT